MLSVVVVNWSARADLDRCLASLASQTHADLDVVVVDNGSTDGSVAWVRAHFPRVTLVAEKENLGFAEGCNRGIAQARGDWVCLLNNDAVAEPDWARALAHAASEAPAACGMLQSLMIYADRPGIVNSTGIELMRDGGGVDRGDGDHRSRWTTSDEIFCPTAGAAAYRRSMLDGVRLPCGWLDPAHFLYFEDLDLGWRARLCGWTARYVPGAVVHHRWHGSSERHGRARLAELATVNRLRTLLKNASAELLVTSGGHTLLGAARMALAAGPRSVGALGRGAREALALRAAVDAMRRCDRRALEAEWVRR